MRMFQENIIFKNHIHLEISDQFLISQTQKN